LLIIGLLMVVTSGVCLAQREAAATAERRVSECIKNEDVTCVSEFLGRGGNAAALDDEGSPLLMAASETKSTQIVRLLINAGADVNVGLHDSTPLCRAALFGRKEIAQTLLEAGAKANVLCDDDHGDSALMEAVRGAMFSDMPAELKATIFSPEELGEINNNEKVDPDSEKFRELLKVSSEDYVEIARMLLARNVDVNVVAKCDVGESALMYAVMGANVNLVRSLLARGADVTKGAPILDFLSDLEIENQRAKSSLLPALSREQMAMADWMEKSRTQREEIVRLLKAAGAKETEKDPLEKDYKGNAEDDASEAFNEAIERNDLKDLVRLLTAYINHPLGAAVLPNALRVAVVYSRVEMVKLLLENGVNPSTPSTNINYTPLMQAASNADLKLVKLLVDAGADLNAEDSSGKTALDAANMYSSEEHRKVVVFLQAAGARSGKKKS